MRQNLAKGGPTSLSFNTSPFQNQYQYKIFMLYTAGMSNSIQQTKEFPVPLKSAVYLIFYSLLSMRHEASNEYVHYYYYYYYHYYSV